MTYTFKLSRRLARLKFPTVVTLSLLTLSCTAGADDLSGPPATEPPIVLSPDSTAVGTNQSVQFEALTRTSGWLSLNKGKRNSKVVRLAVSPVSSNLPQGSPQRFTATATLSDGSTTSSAVSWSATGGTVDGSGKYTAGNVTGKYHVIARMWNGVADTAVVTIVSLARIVVTPASVELPAGATQQFAASGMLSDSSSTTIPVTWSASGGTISAEGLYTADLTAGTYRVVATQTGGSLADTAVVNLTAPTSSPPPPPPPPPPPAPAPSLVRIVVSPASAVLSTGATQQFAASGKLSDSSTSTVAVTWSASGGTISSTGLYTAGQTSGSYRVIAIQAGGTLADTSAIDVTAPPPPPPPPPPAPTLTRIVVNPASIGLQTGATQQFTAAGQMSDGSTSTVAVTWSASGGTISSAGLYTAGQTSGSYRVIAVQTGGTLADTSAVNITAPAPTLTRIVVTPASVGLQTGATQQFTAAGQMSDGSTSTVAVTWSASGGTISSTGLYAAGQNSGSYRVIAIQAGGTLADTSAISITAPAPAPTGVPILPGQSIQAAVNANSAGTVFLIKAGRHVRQSVVPKDGNTFRCESGAILDGETVTPYAFMRSGTGPDNVRIVGCVIERYAPAAQMGAILAGGASGSDGTSGWIIDSTEVRNNANLGIRLAHRMKVRWSNVHHNGTLGIGGIGDDILVESTEIAYNNPSGGGLGFESGGTKFVRTNRLIVRNNWVHDNLGPGLWADIGNRDFLFENNLVENQLQDGIVIEISYGGIIRNNTCRRNGLGDTRRFAWPWGAGIGIHASGGLGIEISGNRLEGNAYGISLIQQPRGTNHMDPAGVDPEMYVQNINAHDNTITLLTGSLGASQGVDDSGTNGLYSGRNIVFTHNGYSLNGVGFPFAWSNSYRTSTQWRGYGFDTTGSFGP